MSPLARFLAWSTLAVVAVLVLFLAVIELIAPRRQEPLAAATVAAAQNQQVSQRSDAEKTQRFEACRKKLKEAQRLDVLHDLDWKPGRMPRVVAGPTFFTIPIDAKEGFTETVNCFLMAGDTGCVNFDILHWQTGRPVGEFKYCRLKIN